VLRLSFFLTWWGAFLLSALDSSLIFFMPFGVDALVIYLAARDEQLFWMYPILAAAGSLVGGLLTFWIGRKAGKVGLPRLVPQRQIDRLCKKVQERGAAALALPAILPPPFPLTPYVLTCGALQVNPWWFFPTYTGVRLLRFSIGATLGHLYGPSILRVLESQTMQRVVIGFIALAVVGTLVSAGLLWRNAQQGRLRAA
jgi:membrane protein YqaA with SNARE-associated domain